MLDVGQLRAALLEDPYPSSVAEAVERWSSGYSGYVSNAVAIPVTLLSFNKAAFVAAMLPLAPVDFFAAFDSGLVAGWASSVWLSPGFTGASVASSGVGAVLKATGAEMMSLNLSREAAVARLCSAIDTYTRTAVSVVWTNVTTGATGTTLVL
jgi:hypothetical protein